MGETIFAVVLSMLVGGLIGYVWGGVATSRSGYNEGYRLGMRHGADENSRYLLTNWPDDSLRRRMSGTAAGRAELKRLGFEELRHVR